MTKSRVYGEDTAFGAWIRRNKYLASDQFCVIDKDMIIHRYKQEGSRSIQNIAQIEEKIKGREPEPFQIDTLFKFHVSSKGRYELPDKTLVINHGVSVVIFSGMGPEDSDTIRWGRFMRSGRLKYANITTEHLTLLLQFMADHDHAVTQPR